MRKQLLLPRGCRIAGLVLLPFAAWLLWAVMNGNFKLPFLTTNIKVHDFLNTEEHYNLTGDVAVTALICSLLMIAFSRLRQEDEYLVHLRLRALQIAVYINYAAFLLATYLVNGLSYLVVMECNVVALLVVFILVFNLQLYVSSRTAKSHHA
jgi:hypothetical protein